MALKKWTLLLYSGVLIHFIYAIPERGIKDMVFDKDGQFKSFAKNLFKDAKITISAEIIGTADDGKQMKVETLSLKWYLLYSSCSQFFLQVKDDLLPTLVEIEKERVMHSQFMIYSKGDLTLKDGNLHKMTIPCEKVEITSSDLKNARTYKPTLAETSKQGNATKSSGPEENSIEKGRIRRGGMDGNYLLVIALQEKLPKGARVEVTAAMKMNTGYLSAAEWPLLPFYGAISLVYLVYGISWLILSACHWKELIGIQFWIGGVVALGLLEKTVLFFEYNNVNNTGVPAHSLVVVLALVFSCVKRTLTKILTIIVSMGFGIVRPQLGAAMFCVLGVGFLHFVLAIIEGSYREFSEKRYVNQNQLIASLPMSILDAIILLWIFWFLRQTIRKLRICENHVMLSMYRHFTSIIIVSVIALEKYLD